MNEQDLLRLKKQIDTAKNEINQLEGRKKYLMQQIQDNWKCKDLDTAKKKLKKFRSEIEDLEEKIENGLAEIEEKYEVE